MARLFNNLYPYTDFHELNIGWCVQKITEFEARVTSVEEDVAALKVRATALEARMSAAENKLTQHTSQISALETSSASHETRIQALENADIQDAAMLEGVSSVSTSETAVTVNFSAAAYADGVKTAGTDAAVIPAATSSKAGVMLPGEKAKLAPISVSGNDVTFAGTVSGSSPVNSGDYATKAYVDSMAISGSAEVTTVLNEAEHWFEGTLTNIVDYDFTTIKTYGKMVYLNFSITHTLDTNKLASTQVFGARLPKACYGSCGGPVMIWNKTDDEFIPANISFDAPLSGNDFFLAGVVTKKAISSGKELVVLGQFTYMSNN